MMLSVCAARLALAIAALLALSACALMDTRAATESASGARETRLAAGASVERVSYRGPSPLRVSQPVGLTPCAQGVFPASDCWRKGDEHVLFPVDAPSGEPSALTPPIVAGTE